MTTNPDTTITQRDLRVYPSERQTDYDDGGGMPLGTPISGKSNEIFDPISNLERVQGEWSTRLVYVGVQRPDDAPLYGAYVVITEPANDDATTYLAMPSPKFGARRDEIVRHITDNLVIDDEAYLSAPGKVHTEGDDQLYLAEKINESDPINAGDVIYLQGSYVVTIKNSQKKYTYGEFAKVTAVEEYAYQQGNQTGVEEKTGTKVTLKRPIKKNYTKDYVLQQGNDSSAAESYLHRIYKTRLIGQSRFYGIQPLVNSVAKGTQSLKVTSINANIAPMANGEPVEVDGIEVLRLPPSGMVQILQVDDEILISNSQTDDLGSAHKGGATVELSRSNLVRICLSDADGTPINAELWQYDLEAGSITWAETLDLSEYVMPVTAKHTQQEINRITAVNADGTLSLMFKTLHDYDAAGTYVSSIIATGDLRVSMSIPFTQQAWTDEWADEPIGDELLNKLNLRDYPAVLTDDGAIDERWMIRFTSSSQFELWGETLGFVGRFDILTDLAPTNPATGAPYFTIPKQAFGNEAPWSAQDVIRFNTSSTLAPIVLIRVVSPNRNPSERDGMTLCVFGDTTETID